MAKDNFTKKWITDNAIEIVGSYEPGILTLRGLHYLLVSRGMTNTLNHYKRVVNAMIDARWEGTVDFDAFSDHDRGMIGVTKSETTDLDTEIINAKQQIDNWMRYYSKNRWENQDYYPEVFIEKKALQGLFQKVCDQFDIALGACKGYPSLTFLNEAKWRFINAQNRGVQPIILYFGDYDPSGEDIPRSIEVNLRRLGVDVEVRRIALLESDVIELSLPPAPVKAGDSRSDKWDGLGQVELDAVKPDILSQMCRDAINDIFDKERHSELLEQEADEKEEYVFRLKQYVKSL